MISANAHLRLLEAQHQGILKPLEEKYNVQICVINNHSLMVHITGSHVLEAETDLYRLLEGTIWRKKFAPKNVAGTSNSVPNTNTKLVTENAFVQEPPTNVDAVTDNSMTESDPVVNLDDDDDITCLEVSVTEPSKSDLPPKRKHADNSVNIPPQSNPTFYLDETPSAVEVIDSTRTENDKAEEETAENSTPRSNEDSVSPSWKNYESPLTGLCIAIDPPENTDAIKDQVNLISKEKDEREKPANEASVTADAPEENVVEVQQVKRCYDIIQVIETLDASSDFSESESIDHTEKNRSKPNKADQLQDVRSTSNRDSPELDLIVVDPPPKVENYEVITIDDDDEPVTKRQKIVHEENGNEETVSLLPSEWDLVMSESIKKGNILDRLANSNEIVVEVSKESSSIIIREGDKKSRKTAKEGIVFWLESQCLNTGTRKEHEHVAINGTPKPGPSSAKKRVLNLNDAHQCNPPGERAKQKKLRWRQKQNRKMRKQKKLNSSTNAQQDVSPTGSSSNSTCSSGTGTPTKKNKFKKGNTSSSLFNSRSPLHSPSPKKMRRRQKTPNNNNNPEFSTPSASAKPVNKRVRYFQNQNE